MPKRAGVSRAGTVERVSWYFAEERPAGPPPKPFRLIYEGEGVEEVKGVGLFQNGTSAECDAATAETYRGRAGWRVVAQAGAAAASEGTGSAGSAVVVPEALGDAGHDRRDEPEPGLAQPPDQGLELAP